MATKHNYSSPITTKQPISMPSLLDQLNHDQLQAVTHGTGPLLIVAGAGTGKTKVLTHRIAYLIEQGQAQSQEILALTFTEKAAAEMEVRVDELLPYGCNDVLINTFHAFGDRIIREYALDLGLPAEFKVIGEDEQRLFLEDRFEEIADLNQLRPLNSPKKFASAILKVINRAKDELITPIQYLKTAQSLIKSAKTTEASIDASRQLEIAKVYFAYEDFKAEKGIIDFGDQILLLVKLIDEVPHIATKLRARFKFILVDEFQDTNIAQYQLIKRLLNPAQNLTVVGDDDQAIYKFRGAAASNILDFLADFPDAKKVILNQNYRSHQPILDTAYRLISHNNPDRLELALKINKKLVAKDKNGVEPTFLWYEHEADELTALVDKIKTLLKTKLSPSQIAILPRSNHSVTAIASALLLAGIPYIACSDQTFLYKAEIQGAAAFLKLLAHPSDSVSFVKLCLSPLCRFDPAWILPVNDLARKSNLSISVIIDNDDSTLWKKLPPTGQQAINKLNNDLKNYRHLIGIKNAGEILYQFLRDYGILDLENTVKGQLNLNFSLDQEQHYQIIGNLAVFFEAIKKYLDAGKDPFLLEFVDQLDSLLGNIIPPNVNAGPGPGPGPDPDAVQILTVHAAKGLEFDTVLVPFLVTDRFPARRKNDPLELPASLIKEHLPTGDSHLQEERRLFYVAMTRAKKRLYLSGAKFYSEGIRAKKISPFVAETFGPIDPEQTISLLNPVSRIHIFDTRPTIPGKILQYPQVNGVLILSPAAIETYLRCPYEFYWRYVLKAPTPTTHHLIYGIAIHAGIEAYHRQLLTSGSADLNLVIQRYSETWKSEGFESQKHENERFDAGIVTLKNFYHRTLSLPKLIEENFTITLPGVRIRGRMDAVFENPKEIRDFKTSLVKNEQEAKEKLRANLPLKIYALAYLLRFGTLPNLITLDFVETGICTSLTPTDKLIEKTKTAIQTAVEGIKSGKFDPNPRQHWCSICNN